MTRSREAREVQRRLAGRVGAPDDEDPLSAARQRLGPRAAVVDAPPGQLGHALGREAAVLDAGRDHDRVGGDLVAAGQVQHAGGAARLQRHGVAHRQQLGAEALRLRGRAPRQVAAATGRRESPGSSRCASSGRPARPGRRAPPSRCAAPRRRRRRRPRARPGRRPPRSGRRRGGPPASCRPTRSATSRSVGAHQHLPVGEDQQRQPLRVGAGGLDQDAGLGARSPGRTSGRARCCAPGSPSARATGGREAVAHHPDAVARPSDCPACQSDEQVVETG